jgi:hypothetical protein
VLERELRQVVVPREAALPAYLEHAAPVDHRYAPRRTRRGGLGG